MAYKKKVVPEVFLKGNFSRYFPTMPPAVGAATEASGMNVMLREENRDNVNDNLDKVDRVWQRIWESRLNQIWLSSSLET